MVAASKIEGIEGGDHQVSELDIENRNGALSQPSMKSHFRIRNWIDTPLMI